MKKLASLFITLFCVAQLSSQTSFQKTYGVGKGQSIQITNDKGFILMGYEEGQVGLMGICKTDSMGVMQWSSTFGSNPNFMYGYCARQTTDGGYILAGNLIYSTNQTDNIVLIKLSATGVIQWHKYYNYFGTIAQGFSVQQTNDGGYILVGQNYANSLILKTDANGNMLWAKSITNMAIAKCIQKTSNGGFVIAGYGSAPTGSAGFDFSLIKIDSSGNLLWSKTFGGIDRDLANSVKETSDGGYIIAGTTESYGVGAEDVYLVKTDSAGNLTWAKTFGGTLADRGNDVIQTTDGGFAIAGTTNSYGVGNSYDAYLIKTDALGTLQWSKTFGDMGDEMAASLVQTHDGGFAVYAYTTSSFALYNKPNMYLIKT
ncbi:MAG TPA: hypothetical protein VN698_04635, partial [Bacteroidia bacterium]|nr:hypothetical protein [Bacteroidia bacterium]